MNCYSQKRGEGAKAFEAKARGIKEKQILRKVSSSGRRGITVSMVDEETEAPVG